MQWMFGRTALWLWVTALSAAVAFGAGQQDLPEGQGKNLLEFYCTTCHNLDRVKRTHVDKESWTQILDAMSEKRDGPMLTEEDRTIMLDYLVKNLGDPGAAPAATAGDAAGGAGDAQTKQLIQMNCTVCHGLDLVEAKHMDKQGWTDVVQGMVGLGAQLTEAQIPAVIDYLAKTYPPEAK